MGKRPQQAAKEAFAAGRRRTGSGEGPTAEQAELGFGQCGAERRTVSPIPPGRARSVLCPSTMIMRWLRGSPAPRCRCGTGCALVNKASRGVIIRSPAPDAGAERDRAPARSRIGRSAAGNGHGSVTLGRTSALPRSASRADRLSAALSCAASGANPNPTTAACRRRCRALEIAPPPRPQPAELSANHACAAPHPVEPCPLRFRLRARSAAGTSLRPLGSSLTSSMTGSRARRSAAYASPFTLLLQW